MEHKFPFRLAQRENWTTFSKVPFLPEIFQWTELKVMFRFTSQPELPEKFLYMENNLYFLEYCSSKFLTLQTLSVEWHVTNFADKNFFTIIMFLSICAFLSKRTPKGTSACRNCEHLKWNSLSGTKHNFQALKGATSIPFSDDILSPPPSPGRNRNSFLKVFFVRALQCESEKREH